MENEMEFHSVVARFAGLYLELLNERDTARATAAATRFLTDFGYSGWADLCAHMVHTAMTSHPEQTDDATKKVAAARLAADELSSALSRRHVAATLKRTLPFVGPAGVPDEMVDQVLATGMRALGLIRDVITAGPEEQALRAVFAAGIDEELAGPVLMYAVQACRNAHVTPTDLSGSPAEEAGSTPQT